MLLLSGGLRTERPVEAIKPLEVFGTPCRIAFWRSVPRCRDLVFQQNPKEFFHRDTTTVQELSGMREQQTYKVSLVVSNCPYT